MPTTIECFTVEQEVAKYGPNKGRQVWYVSYRGGSCGPMMDFFERGMGLTNPWPFKEDGSNEFLTKEGAEEAMNKCINHVREVVGNKKLDKNFCSAKNWTI